MPPTTRSQKKANAIEASWWENDAEDFFDPKKYCEKLKKPMLEKETDIANEINLLTRRTKPNQDWKPKNHPDNGLAELLKRYKKVVQEGAKDQAIVHQALGSFRRHWFLFEERFEAGVGVDAAKIRDCKEVGRYNFNWNYRMDQNTARMAIGRFFAEDDHAVVIQVHKDLQNCNCPMQIPLTEQVEFLAKKAVDDMQFHQVLDMRGSAVVVKTFQILVQKNVEMDQFINRMLPPHLRD